jgi:hypothetical protein
MLHALYTKNCKNYSFLYEISNGIPLRTRHGMIQTFIQKNILPFKKTYFQQQKTDVQTEKTNVHYQKTKFKVFAHFTIISKKAEIYA